MTKASLSLEVLLEPLSLGRGGGEREAFVFAVALPLLGPHKAVAVEPADRPVRVKHMDVRVFLQDRDVL